MNTELAPQYRKKPNVRTVWIVGDSELADELRDSRDKLKQLGIRLQAQRPESQLIPQLSREHLELEEKVERLDAELRESSIEFKFQAMGAGSFEKLVNKHPATDQQIAEAKNSDPPTEVPGFNPATYPQELIGRCMTSPLRNNSPLDEPLDEAMQAYVDWIFGDDWNQVEQTDLFNAALGCNLSRRSFDLGKG